MTISKDHYLDLVDGRFRETSREDLRRMFAAVEQSPDPDHLVVHFHGGLVPRASGESIAERLLTDYQEASGYPVFFLWNSGALTTLRYNLDEVAKEPVFWRFVRRLAQWLVGKIAQTVGDRGGPVEMGDLPPVDPEALYRWAAAREPHAPGALDAEISSSQEKQLLAELHADRVLQREAQAIVAGLREPAEIERDIAVAARGAAAPRASQRTLLSRRILKEIGEQAPDRGERGVTLILALARYGVTVAHAVLKRYRAGRDHGLLTTVIEEVARTLYADSIGSIAWTLMKKDTADAFGPDPAIHGGTAFVAELAQWWQPGRRISLVGHSTGAIYIGHLLERLDGVLPAEARCEVVFLAPACTFEFMQQRLGLLDRRVRRFRMFALQDDLERGYWEVPLLYPASLLYLVSGLFEDPETDKPIVGMQRYHSGAEPYREERILDVLRWIDDRCVWSVSDQGPGHASAADRHGDFDDDAVTRDSVKAFLTEAQ